LTGKNVEIVASTYDIVCQNLTRLSGEQGDSGNVYDIGFFPHLLWNIVLSWNPVPTRAMSIFQSSREHVRVALTVIIWRFFRHVLRSDRSDCFASPSEEEEQVVIIVVIVITSLTISYRFVLPEDKTTSLVPHAFFQVINPRNALFCEIAQPVSRVTVTAVECPSSTDFTQAVEFHALCLSR
jgi:hypothetical protein